MPQSAEKSESYYMEDKLKDNTSNNSGADFENTSIKLTDRSSRL